MSKNKIKIKGFTLIEALIFLFIFTIAALSILQAFSLGMNYSIESKKKLQAITLANEEIEKMRNLGYENLTSGTTENAEIEKNGITYNVTTRITDFDDDGDAVYPADEVSWDYYKIGVEVNWGTNNKKINMSAIVVPPVREEDADKGYMRLHIIDQNGDGLPSVLVSVRDLTTSRLVYSGPVNTSGNLFLTGLDPNKHKITIGNSNDYYPVETIDTTANFDPYDEHAEIAVKTLTEKYIQTDKESTLNVAMKDTFGNTISNLGFDIEGGKYLGLENGTTAVYDFDDSISSSDGTESFSDMCFGPYFFNFTDLNDGTETYQFLWMNPESDAENKVSLNADSSLDAEAILAKESVPSLLVTVLDNADDSPIPGAKVHLQFSGTPAYDVELTANEFGKVYFPESVGEIINENYDITVTADGYGEETDTITIDNFTNETVKLTAS